MSHDLSPTDQLIRPPRDLITGTTLALRSLPGESFAPGCLVFVKETNSYYGWNATSTDADSPPFIIVPRVTVGGRGRWILLATLGGGEGEGGVSTGETLDWYPQRSDITRNAAGPFTPLILKTDPELQPRLYAPIAPILVTIDVSMSVNNPGVGGEITLDVQPFWGTSPGTNTFFRFDAVINAVYRVSTICAIFGLPLVDSAISIQWTAVALPVGSEIQINNDNTQSGSHYIVKYVNRFNSGQARV